MMMGVVSYSTVTISVFNIILYSLMRDMQGHTSLLLRCVSYNQDHVTT